VSIQVRDLVKIYDKTTIVHGISFDVDKGEFMSLLGPSGCGKSTTLRCIAGLEDAAEGEIAIAGELVSAPARGVNAPAHERQVGMVFQSYAIWPHMSVAGNVAFPLSIRRMPAAEVARQVDEALEIVGLRALKDRQPSQLSGGQQQRVALARAIVGRPRVLLFDEPLSNLDAKLREGTRSEIRRLQRELDVAAVYVTHDQEEALSMSDRVIVMDHGRILQSGRPKELYRAPANRFVADFVGRASFFPVARGAAGRWTMPDGAAIEIAAEPPEAARYEAMLRPEDVRIAVVPIGGAGSNVLSGRVADAQYVGAHTEYLVEAGGARIKVHARDDVPVGAEVEIAFRPDVCRIVPADAAL
jgi:ABC-type Fe3+/spermidine/putrescine transport system ATPase subunit